MAKSLLKFQAREMRKKGMSVSEITKHLGVSKSSVSLWCSDIELTQKQISILMARKKDRGLVGRLKGAEVQKQKRLREIKFFQQQGARQLQTITKRDLFFLGLGLYWGEGNKTDRRLGFCNSDPDAIIVLIRWLELFDVSLDQLRFTVGVNEIYRHDIERIHQFWYRVTGAQPKQFTQPSFKRVTNKKVYANPNNHYGTLQVRVENPCKLQRKVLGFIYGVKYARIMDKAV
jgi:predicted transcriptional regulator